MDENRSSLIGLDDGEAVGLDNGGKSPAYFCCCKPVAVTRELVTNLVARGTGTEKEIQLCLHEWLRPYFRNRETESHYIVTARAESQPNGYGVNSPGKRYNITREKQLTEKDCNLLPSWDLAVPDEKTGMECAD